jgi:4-aminobutyrate aminotransferase-like enzyme
MTMVNAYAGDASGLSEADRALVARRERLLGPAYRLFYNDPVHLVRGEGVWLYDPEGRAYLDAYNNVASVGHCHPHVVEALARQAAVLNTHTRYLNEVVIQYAERLLARFPPELARVLFTCTGSEANDLAVRIAKTFTGGTGLIVTRNAYHGGTDVVAGFSPSLGAGVPLGEHVRTVPAPDSLRIPPAEIGVRFAAGVEAAVADLTRHGIRPAALIVDTVFSSDGVFPDPAGFLAPAVEAIRAAGGLFVADEVQAGFGRTGEAMWGFERHGVTPDMVTLGKPMGAGHPIAGLVVRPEMVERFGRTSRYFNTFGGNPVSCAVGAAVLDVMERDGLQASADAVGRDFKAKLQRIAGSHPQISDVRGVGLYLGVEFLADAPADAAAGYAAEVVNALRDRRILVSATGPKGNVLKIRPPLVFARQHADLVVEALDEILGELGKGQGQ